MRNLLPAVLAALALHGGMAHAGAYEDILAAAEHNRTGVVLDLLNLGMDANTSTPEGTTLLMTAARNGNLELLEILLKKRANHLIRNSFGDTALMAAALGGHLAVVKRLLELGGPQENRDGWTPLHYAAFGGHVDVARYLLAKGAKVDAPAPNSQTALMLAVANGHVEMVKALLDEQSNRKLKDRDGRTALDIARARGNKQIVDYMSLFDAGE